MEGTPAMPKNDCDQIVDANGKQIPARRQDAGSGANEPSMV
jgi:hypothetical protein